MATRIAHEALRKAIFMIQQGATNVQALERMRSRINPKAGGPGRQFHTTDYAPANTFYTTLRTRPSHQ